jgi:hypothetical protein
MKEYDPTTSGEIMHTLVAILSYVIVGVLFLYGAYWVVTSMFAWAGASSESGLALLIFGGCAAAFMGLLALMKMVNATS